MSKQLTRLRQIVSELQSNPQLKINDLAEAFGVSSMTIRRDLAYLANNQIAELVPGGGVRINADTNFFGNTDTRYSLDTAEPMNREQKMRIGERAVQLVEQEDIIIFDTGSTTEFVAKLIPDTLKCTVICYTMNILVEVHKKLQCSVIFAGGFYHKDTMMFESPEGVSLIKRSRAKKAFISPTGISDRLGVTCQNEYELATRRAAIESSLTRVLLADSSKFDTVWTTHFASLDDFDVLITDSGIPEKYREMCLQAGIELHVV